MLIKNFHLEKTVPLAQVDAEAAVLLAPNSDLNRIKRMLELPSPITITDITKRHIQRRVNGSWRAEEAEEIMKLGENEGFGTIENIQYNAGSQKRNKKVFVKRKVEELNEEKLENLKILRVDFDKYKA